MFIHEGFEDKFAYHLQSEFVWHVVDAFYTLYGVHAWDAPWPMVRDFGACYMGL